MDWVIQQLKNYFDSKHISQKEIADTMGVKPQYINAIFGGRRSIGHKIADMFEEKYNISKIWLLTGEGEMLKEIKLESETKDGNPIVDDFVGSLGSYIGDGNVALTDDNIRDRMSIPGLRDKSIVYLPVAGDSMIDRDNPENSIPDGAMVAVSPALLSTFRGGEVYALVTPEGVVVKKVMPGDGDHIRCESFNSEKYPTYELCSDEVLSAWRVVGVVSVRYR